MEPVTTTVIYSTLCYFIGYYVGCDIYSYYKQTLRYNETINKLDSTINKLDSIESRLSLIESRLSSIDSRIK